MAYLTANDITSYINKKLNSLVFYNKRISTSYKLVSETQTYANANGKSIVKGQEFQSTEDSPDNIGNKCFIINKDTDPNIRHQYNKRESTSDVLNNVSLQLAITGNPNQIPEKSILTADSLYKQILATNFTWSTTSATKNFNGVSGVERFYGPNKP